VKKKRKRRKKKEKKEKEKSFGAGANKIVRTATTTLYEKKAILSRHMHEGKKEEKSRKYYHS